MIKKSRTGMPPSQGAAILFIACLTRNSFGLQPFGCFYCRAWCMLYFLSQKLLGKSLRSMWRWKSPCLRLNTQSILGLNMPALR